MRCGRVCTGRAGAGTGCERPGGRGGAIAGWINGLQRAIDHGISAIDQAQSAISDAISMIERAMDDCRMLHKPESTHRPVNGSK